VREVSLNALEGVLVVPRKLKIDGRGSFTKIQIPDLNFYSRELAICSASSVHPGTIRGIHFQDSPFPEQKIISVGQGESFHVFLDIRHYSSTYLSYGIVNMNESSGFGVYVPEGIAHGYQTLRSDTSIDYLISGKFVAAYQKCINVFDPTLDIKWPLPVSTISERDVNGSFVDNLEESCGW